MRWPTDPRYFLSDNNCCSTIFSFIYEIRFNDKNKWYKKWRKTKLLLEFHLSCARKKRKKDRICDNALELSQKYKQRMMPNAKSILQEMFPIPVASWFDYWFFVVAPNMQPNAGMLLSKLIGSHWDKVRIFLAHKKCSE